MDNGLFATLEPLVRGGRLREAAAQLRLLVRAGACLWETYLWKGRIEEKLGRFPEAEGAYRRALGAGASRGASAMEFARFLEGRDRLEEAEAQLLCAHRLGGPVFEIHLGLGRLREKLGHGRAAAADFKKAAAAAPASPLPLIGLARVLIKAGRPADAERRLRRALELGGAPGEARLLLGQVLGAQGRTRAAESQLCQAARAAPGSALLRLELARFLDRAGRSAQARRAFQDAAAAAEASGEVLTD